MSIKMNTQRLSGSRKTMSDSSYLQVETNVCMSDIKETTKTFKVKYTESLKNPVIFCTTLYVNKAQHRIKIYVID